MRRTTLPALTVAALLVAAGCSSSSGDATAAGTSSASASSSTPSPSSSAPASSGSESGSASTGAAGGPVLSASVDRVIARGLDAPWGLAFLPDGSALVSQRDDDLIVHVTSGGDAQRVGQVDGVDGSGEGGLLGIALSPAYSSDHRLYAYFTRGARNVIARMTYDGSRLSDQRVIFRASPAAGIHNGGRIAFGPDGMLYVGTGDAGRGDPAQDKNDLGGKILRLTPDGTAAPGNPFDSPVWSYGHRNVQGLAWDASGQLWASEFGQNTWDELNRIVKGGNYGWPVVEGHSDDTRYRNPARQWHTDEASPSGIAFAGGSVWMPGLRGERLWQIPIVGGRAGTPRALFSGRYGRLRTVAAAPDGSLWLMTNNTDGRGNPRDGDDRLIRLTLS